MIRLLTPLVVGIVLAVSVLAVARLVLLPDLWMSSICALVFMPGALGILVLRARFGSQSTGSIKASGSIRAALVGAGTALAVALLLSITDEFGLIPEQFADSNLRSLAALVPAFGAVAFDLFTARLEQKARDETKDD